MTIPLAPLYEQVVTCKPSRADLRTVLRAVSPGGLFAEQPTPVALDVWRPARG